MKLPCTLTWRDRTGWSDEEAGGRRQDQVHRPVRSGARHHPPSACRASHHCSADGVVSLEPRHRRDRHPCLQVSIYFLIPQKLQSQSIACAGCMLYIPLLNPFDQYCCRELGIGIVPYSPLGRGFFSGKAVIEKLSETDSRTVTKISNSTVLFTGYSSSPNFA